MLPLGYRPVAELGHTHRDSAAPRLWLKSVEDQVSADVGRVVQTSKSDMTARGVAYNLLQMAKRISPQCKATEYEDLSGEKGLILDRIVVEDRA